MTKSTLTLFTAPAVSAVMRAPRIECWTLEKGWQCEADIVRVPTTHRSNGTKKQCKTKRATSAQARLRIEFTASNTFFRIYYGHLWCGQHELGAQQHFLHVVRVLAISVVLALNVEHASTGRAYKEERKQMNI